MEIGGYRIEDELGRGAMGVVYRAYDPQAEREVALKLLSDTRGLATERLQREAELTARLDHPGIVRIHSAGRHRGRPFVVYELVQGAKTLDEVMREGAEPAQLARWIADAGHALGAAHAAGIVHRDVKPANILIDGEGRLRIADFGVAIGDDLERMTRTGALVGTPRFMAPEQFAGKSASAPGPTADVWSLGIILYEGLSGGRVYRATSLIQLAAEVAGGPRPLREVAPKSDPRLRAIVRRALALEPSERYPDGEALATDLERYLAGEQEVGLPVVSAAPQPVDVRGRGRFAGVLGGLVALLAVVAVGLGWVGWRQRVLSEARASAERELSEAHRLDAGLAARVQELRARLGDEPSAALLGLEGLLAVADEDEEQVERCLEALSTGPSPGGVREALQAGLALLSGAGGRAALEAAEQARSAHMNLHLVELTSWEARLRARADSDSERAAAIRLFGQLRAKRPLDEVEREELLGACERLERAPSSVSLRAFEGVAELAPIRSASAVHTLLAQGQPEPVRAARLLRACDDPLPAFLTNAASEQARGWNEQGLTLLGDVGEGSEGRRATFRRLSALLELIRRFELGEACSSFLGRARQLGLRLTPAVPPAGGPSSERGPWTEAIKMQRVQLEFLAALLQIDPSDLALVSGTLRVRAAFHSNAFLGHDRVLAALRGAGTSSQARAYLRACAAAARVEVFSSERAKLAEEALALLQPLCDRYDELGPAIPQDPGFPEGLRNQPRLPALVAAASAQANHRLARWKEAERWFERLRDLEEQTWTGLWAWRVYALRNQVELARRLPERSRSVQLKRVLGKVADRLRSPDVWTYQVEVARILWYDQEFLSAADFELMLRALGNPLSRAVKDLVEALKAGKRERGGDPLSHLCQALERLGDPEAPRAKRLLEQLGSAPVPALLERAEALGKALAGR